MVYGNYISIVYMDGDTGELNETFRSIKAALSTGHICAILSMQGSYNVGMNFIVSCAENEGVYTVSALDGTWSCDDPDAYPIYYYLGMKDEDEPKPIEKEQVKETVEDEPETENSGRNG